MPHPLAKSLLVSDLHLTSNERDEYRWGLFPWIRGLKHVERLWVLGDLTDAKDYHPSQLVNRMVDELEQLAQIMEVHILRGNHDGIDPEWPYFRFLNALPNVSFYSEPACQGQILILPHTRDWKRDWADLDLDYEVILLHATMQGAEAEAGGSLSGIPVSLFAETRALILAGDVHVPQKVGPVEYIGAPYPIRFGDSFKPRAVYFDERGRTTQLHYESLSRHSIILDGIGDLNLSEVQEGDQCKIRVRLSKAEALEWHLIKTKVQEACKRIGADLVSLELERAPDGGAVSLKKAKVATKPEESFSRYCAQKRIPPHLQELGRALMKTTQGNAVKTL